MDLTNKIMIKIITLCKWIFAISILGIPLYAIIFYILNEFSLTQVIFITCLAPLAYFATEQAMHLEEEMNIESYDTHGKTFKDKVDKQVSMAFAGIILFFMLVWIAFNLFSLQIILTIQKISIKDFILLGIIAYIYNYTAKKLIIKPLLYSFIIRQNYLDKHTS